VREICRFGAHVVAVIIAGLAVSACGDSPTAPLAFAPYSEQDLRLGEGTVAASGNVVSVRYTLWLYDADATDHKGPMVESNVTAAQPFTLRLSSASVIEGFDDGVTGMLEGGLRRVTVPPSLGYGGVRNGSIPPNSTLVFEIELIDVA